MYGPPPARWIARPRGFSRELPRNGSPSGGYASQVLLGLSSARRTAPLPSPNIGVRIENYPYAYTHELFRKVKSRDHSLFLYDLNIARTFFSALRARNSAAEYN